MGLIKSTHLAMFAIAASFVFSGSGCAAERDPIDQTQIGALPKQFFVGPLLEDESDDPEFYFRTTVVDVAAGAGSESLFTSSDSQPTVRIRWEITETTLIARLAYELIDDTDYKGTTSSAPRGDAPTGPKAPSQTTTDGQIVAAFAITKQFDIRRDYNTQTGEENNLIVENDHDRPWNQRDYIRVDWSHNQITDAYDLDAVSQMGMYGGMHWDPVSYYVNDPSNPDSPVVDLEKGYFDVTTKAYASPQMIHDDELGDYPACQLVGEYPTISCNPSEVKLRHSFRKVVDTDYEPLDFDGRRMEMFGFFTDDRYGYDRRAGLVDQKWHRFISRWNVYDKSHVTLSCNTPDSTQPGDDPHRDQDGNGTEDECESIGRGSKCDEFRHQCTIPLRDRKVKTIPWFVNREFPADLFEGTKKVVDTWSDAVRVGILSGRLSECRHTGEQGCEAQMGWPARWSDDFVPPIGDSATTDVPRVFVLCHNPVDPANDDPACGKEGTSPRMGDLRYNFISYITQPQAQMPWGIMVDAEDALTGEKVSGSVNQWGAVLDRAAATLADLVQLINGTTSPDAFIQGQDISEWVSENLRGGVQNMPAPMSADELASRLSAFDPQAMTPFVTGKAKAKRAGKPTARFKARMQALESAGKLTMGNPAIVQRFGQLRNGAIESKMVTPDVAQLSGFDPTAPITKSVIDRATPFARVSPLFRRTLEQRARLGLAKRHACRREAPEADHLLGLAHKAQKLFGTVDPKDVVAVRTQRDKIFQWGREQYAIGVFAHEFGHSMGLRHNFAGSFDSVNYDNHYWQLRTKDGSVTKTCAAGTTDGSGCIGPRYNDPITQDEIDGGIGGFSTTSVMDYPGDQAQDMTLPGKYDRAALRFGYGGTVDVWNEMGSVTGGGDAKVRAYKALGLDDPPGLFGVKYFPLADKADYEFIHYSQFQQVFNLVSGCHADADSPTGTTCLGAAMDVVDYRDMKDYVSDPTDPGNSTTSRGVDAKGRVRRGYMFSSDEYADSGNVPAFTYDSGADPYEQIRFLEAAYENRYVLDNFRRGRTMFNSYDVTARVQSHYLDTIQLVAKTYAFAMVLENDDPTQPSPQLLVDGNYGPLAVGSTVAFDLFARMLTRPEPGSYCSTADANCPGTQPNGLVNNIFVADGNPQPTSAAYPFKVPLGAGRYIHNDFDYGQGYWWSDYQKQVGSFYDKTQAVYYLSEAFDSFISNSKEDFVDGRYKNVNFATVYPGQMRRLMGTLLTGDIDTYAPWSDSPTTVAYPAWHTAADLGARPASAKLMDPAFGFNEQLYTMVWGTMFLPTAWTQDFINDARITALQSEQITWPAAETTTFIDPVTSLTYRAHSTGLEKLFGVDHEKSIGARMLEWANNMLCVAYTCTTDAQGFILLNTDGTPKLKLTAGKPTLNPDFPGADADLKKYVTNIEVMRQLVTTYVRPLDDSLPSP